MNGLRRKGRLLWRLLRLVLVFVFAGLDHFLNSGRSWDTRQRAQWLSKWSRRLLGGIGFQVKQIGAAPAGAFVTPNHLGYIDILVLASLSPQVFLSKLEVARWPVVGAYTKMAGTLFIDRRRRAEVAEKGASFRSVLQAGVNMTVFLEGTSSDGNAILPFRSSLLQPILDNNWPVAPAYLKYECAGGSVETDVCWWGDMGFGIHLYRLLQLERVDATVVFGSARTVNGDRKDLAIELRSEVESLAEQT